MLGDGKAGKLVADGVEWAGVPVVAEVVEPGLLADGLGKGAHLTEQRVHGGRFIEELHLMEADPRPLEHAGVDRVVEPRVAGEEHGLRSLGILDEQAEGGPVVLAFDLDVVGGEKGEPVPLEQGEPVLAGLFMVQGQDEEVILEQRVSTGPRAQAALERVVPQVHHDAE